MSYGLARPTYGHNAHPHGGRAGEPGLAGIRPRAAFHPRRESDEGGGARVHGSLQAGDDGQVDLEMFEDLLIAAINQAVGKSKEMMNEEMDSATGGLAGGFPGLF